MYLLGGMPDVIDFTMKKLTLERNPSSFIFMLARIGLEISLLEKINIISNGIVIFK